MVRHWHTGGDLAGPPVHQTQSADLCCSYAAPGIYAALYPPHSTSTEASLHLAGTAFNQAFKIYKFYTDEYTCICLNQQGT